MKVSKPNVVISNFNNDEEMEAIRRLLIFLNCYFNEFEVDGDKRIEVFQNEY